MHSGSRAGRLSSAWREPTLAASTGALVLLASLVNFLGHNEYPLLRPEVGLVAAFFIAVAIVSGLVYATMSGVGRSLLQYVLVLLALDLNFDPIVAVVGTAVIGLVLRRHMMTFLGIAAGVVLTTGLAGIAAGSGGDGRRLASGLPASDAPVLVHIILDEHIGIEGILGDAPETRAIRDKLKAFYLRNDFRLFGGAYSAYFHSVNSIPEILNFGVEQGRELGFKNGAVMRKNAYFDKLGALGYGIHVYQREYIDYCEVGPIVFCETKRRSDFGDMAEAPLTAVEKARLAVNDMGSLSSFFRGLANSYDLVSALARRYDVALPALRPEQDPVAFGALATLDQLASELRQAKPGTAYFVHAFAPHYPYVMDRSCQLKKLSDWMHRDATSIARHDREIAYFDQISCVLTKLDAIFAAAASTPAGANAVFVIHGDHGSRMTETEPRVDTKGRFDDNDLIVSFSALFAVRGPGIEPAYDRRRLPVSKLLEAVAMADFHSANYAPAADFTPTVVLTDSSWTPVERHPLPEWWARPQ